MKQFFKITFACILGVFIAGFIGSILFFFGIISMASISTPAYTPSESTIFKLKLNTAVTERVQIDPLNEIMNTISKESQPTGLDEILLSIEKAQHNNHIIGIYLNTDGYQASYATTEAIRNKLEDFKKTGKFIIAYNSNFSQNQYYLSSIADSIYLNPVGSIQFSGLVSQNIFFKNALDKLGVQMQIFRVGTFKSAIEPFILDKMSPANREQTETYLNSMWNTILSGISSSRNLSIDSLNSIANQGIGFAEATQVLQTGLITGLKYQSDMLPLLENIAGTKNIETPGLDKIKTMKSIHKEYKDQIAILYAVGEITDVESDGIYWQKTVKEIEELKEDESVKGVVFRVNSPGGSAFASEQIWEAINKLKETKPVVVSMGTYAASGGYYISCNADYIVAEPTTLTGSIGVFGMIPNASDLLTNKIGLTFDEVKTNKFGNITYMAPMTDLEKELLQKGVENIYTLFMKRCADGRNLPVDSIAKIAEGRVWSGENAFHLGLVDELGGIDTAIRKVSELANIDKYTVLPYPATKDFIETLMEQLSDEASVRISQHLLGEEFKHVQVLKYIKSLSHIQARMEEIVVK
ncbi:MAG: signal peptide peptidase SppA [Bacteroidales bacterium]